MNGKISFRTAPYIHYVYKGSLLSGRQVTTKHVSTETSVIFMHFVTQTLFMPVLCQINYVEMIKGLFLGKLRRR